MIKPEYIELPKINFIFCEKCHKLMGTCEHEASSTYKIQWVSKEELAKSTKAETMEKEETSI